MSDAPSPEHTGSERERSVHRLAHYVYGTISTLVAVAGLTFETHPQALTTAGVIVVGAVAIWFAHTLSRLVVKPSWRDLRLRWSDVQSELEGSWPIVSAALPAVLIFAVAGLGVWSVQVAFVLTDVVGVLALAVVGVGTAGSRAHSTIRRGLYVTALVAVGAIIVILESLVHVL